MSRNGFASKPVSVHGRNAGTDMLVSHRSIEVRKLAAAIATEGRPSAVVDVSVVDVVDVDHIHAPTAAAPPRVKAITGADGQPANSAESATETEAHAEAAMSPTEEGDISGGPDRIVSRVDSHGT
ncbi:MAG: hypothetical protein ACHP79_15470, partial [Terriglobales bacterium]